MASKTLFTVPHSAKQAGKVLRYGKTKFAWYPGTPVVNIVFPVQTFVADEREQAYIQAMQDLAQLFPAGQFAYGFNAGANFLYGLIPTQLTGDPSTQQLLNIVVYQDQGIGSAYAASPDLVGGSSDWDVPYVDRIQTSGSYGRDRTNYLNAMAAYASVATFFYYDTQGPLDHFEFFQFGTKTRPTLFTTIERTDFPDTIGGDPPGGHCRKDQTLYWNDERAFVPLESRSGAGVEGNTCHFVDNLGHDQLTVCLLVAVENVNLGIYADWQQSMLKQTAADLATAAGGAYQGTLTPDTLFKTLKADITAYFGL